jgi:L-amino acid N-acyltransferase YncA
MNRIRRAEEKDADDLGRIYNQAMKPEVYATCDVSPVSRENRVMWLAHHHDPYPAWVYQVDNTVIGWSSLSPFSVRPLISTIAEISVYVDEGYRSRRVGFELLVHLVEEARRLGFRSLISLAFEKNAVSNAGCLMYGFQPNAVLYEVARMDGNWENVLWLQKDLLTSDPPGYNKYKLRQRSC